MGSAAENWLHGPMHPWCGRGCRFSFLRRTCTCHREHLRDGGLLGVVGDQLAVVAAPEPQRPLAVEEAAPGLLVGLYLSDAHFAPGPAPRKQHAPLDKVREVAEANNYPSRAAPRPPRSRRKTGRTEQLNLRVRAEDLARFVEISDEFDWVFGETFQHLVEAFDKDLARGRNQQQHDD